MKTIIPETSKEVIEFLADDQIAKKSIELSIQQKSSQIETLKREIDALKSELAVDESETLIAEFRKEIEARVTEKQAEGK